MLMFENPLMLKTTHDRIVAEKDAEIRDVMAEWTGDIARFQLDRADLAKELSKADDSFTSLAWDYKDACERIAHLERNKAELLATSAELCDRVEEAEARLAIFTGPRLRGAGGKFLSTKGAVA